MPKELLEAIRVRFEDTDEVKMLRTQQGIAKSEGRYADAMRLAMKIDELFSTAVNEYWNQTLYEVRTMDTETSDIPEKDKEEMIEKLLVLFMACDIIESASIDLNDILHRTKPDLDITSFTDIRQTVDMAKKKLKYLQNNSDYRNDLIWNERCDDMYDMMQSKAKSIFRKRKESKNWGESQRKLEKYGRGKD